MLNENPYKDLREHTGLSREQLAKRLGISPDSIRRYETTNKPPLWYYLLLRVLAGDLSIFGARWVNCSIGQHAKLFTPFDKNAGYYPMDVNEKTNWLAARAAARVADMRDKMRDIEESNAALMFRLLRYENLQSRKNSGKVVPIFNYK
ncbi:MAG: helix-turn-helix domain-containing protein [Methyloprofundus sp.]|nr:helix-turn-helix domain-containing protein [Methyloprofundus sp.]